MNKKINRLLQPDLLISVGGLVIFVALAAVFRQPALAVLEVAIAVLLGLLLRYVGRRRQQYLNRYLEDLVDGTDSATRSSVLNAPLPMAVFRADTLETIWCNDRFLSELGGGSDMFDSRIDELIPNFDIRWITENLPEAPETVWVGQREYRVFGTAGRQGGKSSGSRSGRAVFVTTYWVDVTEMAAACRQFAATRPVVAIVMLDNYEEMMKAGNEAAKSTVLAQLDERLSQWAAPTGGLLRKYDRDRYLFLFEEQYFERIVEEKFSVLDAAHEVVSEDGVTATLSIGIGREADSFQELFDAAGKSIEMALSRGGDQAVVKDSLDFQFYGGKSKSAEKQTKVKSRVMAKALGDLVADSSEVYVMGHTYADMDAVGAACGICCIARKRGKRARIVLDLQNNNAGPLMRRLLRLPEYENAFISGAEAFLHARPGALLVVVDTNRPDMVESQQLLDSCNRVAVIDHHRRASNYIESAALNFHEPYASSASELVTELLQYLVEPKDLLRGEAEALLSGIVLDTKNFTMRTGGRTFEAAAYLRRAGADTTEVRLLFQSDLHSMVERYAIIRQAELVRGDIALAAVETESPRIVAAQAADELLSLKGVKASVVLYASGGGVGMSARSLGDINVQVLMEALGGGGNATTAGGFLPEAAVPDVRERLLKAIDKYFED